MGAVKQAVIEVQDEVANCIEQGLDLEQTVIHCSDLFHKKANSNSYLTDANFIKEIYEDWRGGEL